MKRIVHMTETEKIKKIRMAIDAFSKAVCMSDGPSLAIRQHDPSNQSWKTLCDTLDSQIRKHRK